MINQTLRPMVASVLKLKPFFVNSITRNMCSKPVSANIPRRLEGRVAVVTASSDGIGYAIARRLAQEGAKVVISSRKIENVKRAVQALAEENLIVHGVKCHVGSGPDREHLFQETINKFGAIDILVSNAATNPHVGPVLQCSEPAWNKIFDVNVKSSFLLAKEVLPHLQKSDKGASILFVSSMAGFQPFQLLGAYSVSKTALFGLTKACSLELAPQNIRVNCLAPGIIKTKFSRMLTENEMAKDISLGLIPMDRFGTIEEMGSIAAFLVSDDASYITGEVIAASGGMASRL